MPGPANANPIRRRIASSCVLASVVASTCAMPASAGPIAEHFKQWSANRQAKAARVEKPFSRTSNSMDLSQTSTLRKLRSRLTGKSGDVADTHVMKVEYMKHDRGVLQH